MILKTRSESKELKLFRTLDSRMTLSPSEKQHLSNLRKGYEGELEFDRWVENHLSKEWIVINDIIFEYNNSTYQIDSLLIPPNSIHPIEIKNFSGDYYYENDIWYSSSGKEIKNPILQLKRIESFLRALLHDLKQDYPVKGHLVFVNPEFMLYQAPTHLPIIYPSQLKRFFKALNMQSALINERRLRFANHLLSLQVHDTRYSRIPEYSYESIRKGIICTACQSFSISVCDKIVICHSCGKKELEEVAVLRAVEQFKDLFPDKRMTTTAIYDWCRVIESRHVIMRILSKHFNIIGNRKSAYFIGED